MRGWQWMGICGAVVELCAGRGGGPLFERGRAEHGR